MRDLTFQSTALTVDAVSVLDNAWQDLAHHAIEKNVFLFPWFVRASIPLLAEHKPRIITVYKRDLLIGLTILQPDTGYAKIPVRFYRTCIHYHQYLATPLIRTGYVKDFFRGIGEWLDTTPADKSFIVFNQLSGGHGIPAAAAEVFARQNRQAAVVDDYGRAFITAPPDTETDLSGHISKSRLKNLKRRRKNLSKAGPVTISEFCHEDSSGEWFDDFMRVENLSWKKRSGTSIAENPDDIAFYKALIKDAVPKNGLSMLKLEVGGVAIAYTLDLKADEHVYCVKTAYDEHYSQYSPGVILEHETLKKYYRHGDPVFVDSCTSPQNHMINGLWPDKKRIITLAFAKKGIRHDMVFKSVVLLKKLAGKSRTLKDGGKP